MVQSDRDASDGQSLSTPTSPTPTSISCASCVSQPTPTRLDGLGHSLHVGRFCSDSELDARAAYCRLDRSLSEPEIDSAFSGSAAVADKIFPCRAPAFVFTEATASMTTEYLVKVTQRGSQAMPTSVRLVVDRRHLRHEMLDRSEQLQEEEDLSGRSGSARPGNFRRLKRLLTSRQSGKAIFSARSMHDVLAVSRCDNDPRDFVLVYRSSVLADATNVGTMELAYRASTPTECAEIVEKVRFLVAL